MDAGAQEQGGGPVAQIVEAHLRQAGPFEQVLEVLRQPGVRHREAPWGDEDEPLLGGDASREPFAQLRGMVGHESRGDEGRQEHRLLRGGRLESDPARLGPEPASW
jgi:hypothetical protein